MTIAELDELRAAFGELMGAERRLRGRDPRRRASCRPRRSARWSSSPRTRQCTAGELAKRADLSPGAMTAMLDQLEDERHRSRAARSRDRPPAGDRRAHRPRATRSSPPSAPPWERYWREGPRPATPTRSSRPPRASMRTIAGHARRHRPTGRVNPHVHPGGPTVARRALVKPASLNTPAGRGEIARPAVVSLRRLAYRRNVATSRSSSPALLGQLLRGRGDLLRGGARLLRRGRDLLARRARRLGHRGHADDVLRHLVGVAGELPDRAGDVGGAARDVLDGGADGLERRAGALDRDGAALGARGGVGDHVDDLAGLALDLADQAGDLARGGLGLLGQLADLLGHDREAAALLAGAGGLDGGVERQQVRLLGDAR